MCPVYVVLPCKVYLSLTASSLCLPPSLIKSLPLLPHLLPCFLSLPGQINSPLPSQTLCPQGLSQWGQLLIPECRERPRAPRKMWVLIQLCFILHPWIQCYQFLWMALSLHRCSGGWKVQCQPDRRHLEVTESCGTEAPASLLLVVWPRLPCLCKHKLSLFLEDYSWPLPLRILVQVLEALSGKHSPKG